MIYRVLCNGRDDNVFFLELYKKAERPLTARERLMGAYAANVPTDWGGLRIPRIRNKRARFYFTEKGWRLVGRSVAAVARKNGRVVRVVRRRDPRPSEIVYADDFQVALLPRKSIPRKKRR